MKKSMIAAIAAVVLMMSLVGCTGKDRHDIHKEIYKRYNDLKSFYAEVRITVKNDKTESVYLGRQFFKAPDKLSLVVDSPEEVSGSGYTLKDGKYILKSGFGAKADSEVAFPNEKNMLFVSDFFEEYYKSEETFLETGNTISDSKTTLTCYLKGKSEKRFMQNLDIDNKTYLPLKLTTYDIDKNPVITVEFGEFRRNLDIDERIFD